MNIWYLRHTTGHIYYLSSEILDTMLRFHLILKLSLYTVQIGEDCKMILACLSLTILTFQLLDRICLFVQYFYCLIYEHWKWNEKHCRPFNFEMIFEVYFCSVRNGYARRNWNAFTGNGFCRCALVCIEVGGFTGRVYNERGIRSMVEVRWTGGKRCVKTRALDAYRIDSPRPLRCYSGMFRFYRHSLVPDNQRTTFSFAHK